MEQASATLDVIVDLLLSIDDGGGNGLETAFGRRHIDDDDGAVRASTPPNDVDLTRISCVKSAHYICILFRQKQAVKS